MRTEQTFFMPTAAGAGKKQGREGERSHLRVELVDPFFQRGVEQRGKKAGFVSARPIGPPAAADNLAEKGMRGKGELRRRVGGDQIKEYLAPIYGGHVPDLATKLAAWSGRRLFTKCDPGLREKS